MCLLDRFPQRARHSSEQVNWTTRRFGGPFEAVVVVVVFVAVVAVVPSQLPARSVFGNLINVNQRRKTSDEWDLLLICLNQKRKKGWMDLPMVMSGISEKYG